jgi:CRP/FNR family transcriptional regulator, cyclic AMP receptor protein
MLHSSELVHPFQVVNFHWDTRGENTEKKIHLTTPLNPEEPTSQNSIAALPLVTYQAGETVIADGSRTARVLILKKGAVVIIKEDTEIAKVTEPGAVFGEFSVLLDQPNKVDVRALETSQFYVADAAVLLKQNPIAAHVTMVLARQLDNANDLQMYRALPWIS